ncbi:MAG: tRNA pseudouridine(38-40) synthase TruA [Nitrospinota bacterium]|nr:tRNA pseudouridine(38-40) synthase TruA [Nitrospinota bacterium]
MKISSPKRFAIKIEYDGTNFMGWQDQPNQRTVQSEIENALQKISGRLIRIVASGRTDAGVHALAQVAHFDIHREILPDKIRLALNSLMSGDIVVLQCVEVKKSFHAQHDAKCKTYEYRILNRRAESALRQLRAWHIRSELDINLMKKASQHLLGKLDFTSLCKKKSIVSCPMRTISAFNIERCSDEIVLRVTADGFLRHMVRNIVGTLVEVGRRERPVDSLPLLIESRDREMAGPTAPSHGLSLVKVDYKKEIFED